MTVTTVARYEVDEPARTTVLEALRRAARATRAEPGNLYFHAYRTDDGAIVLIEGWSSPDSLERHRRSAHFTDIVLGEIAPLLRSRHIEKVTPLFEGEFE